MTSGGCIRVASDAEVATILHHPKFIDARDRYIAGYLAIYTGDARLNKLLAEAARHVIITFVICLSAASRADNPDSWLTLGRLQDVAVKLKVGSRGLVEAIVRRMIDWGLLETQVAKADRRRRILIPTSQLLKHDRDIIVAQAIPAGMVLPTPGMIRAADCDPEFQRAFRAISVAAFEPAMTMLMRHPEIMLFYARDSGQMILFSLLASALQSPDGNRAAFSFQEMTNRFGISRTHARDTVAAAVEAGLLRSIRPGGAEIEIAPELWTATHRFLADAMALFATCGDEAMRILGHDANA